MTDKLEKPRIRGVYENKFQVRDARYSDLKSVYQMIIELAVDLKADVSEDVKSTENQFLNRIRNSVFESLVLLVLDHYHCRYDSLSRTCVILSCSIE